MKKLLGATVILIATAMIFSSFSIAAETNPLQLTIKGQSSQTIGNLNRDNIVWDNGGIDAATNGLSSQLDLVYPFNSQTADDFLLEEETPITDVHWWGTFWNYPTSYPNPADFNIIFYADAGGMPTGAGMPDPTPTALKVYNMPQVTGIPTGGVDQFEYEVVLPEPFIASANEHYWIAIQWIGSFAQYGQWGWDTNGDNPEKLSLSVQGFPLLGTVYWTIHGYGDMAFYLTSGEPAVPAICCEGNLIWEDVQAGAAVTGQFQVCNCGEEGSLLNWEVDSYPDWGTNWTFIPSSGTGLAEGDCVTIVVEVVAPLKKKQTFTGKIKMINSDDPTDFCEIDVSLTTPRARTIAGCTLLQWILQRYPNMFPNLGMNQLPNTK
jgi:hypothetical protein